MVASTAQQSERANPAHAGPGAALQRRLDGLGAAPAGTLFRALCTVDDARLPRPGGGQTLWRWQALAAVAARDLSLAKLYEAHVDALAILEELGGTSPAGSTWGVWAAEPPRMRLHIEGDGADSVFLRGRKAWCAGADLVDHALVTAWRGDEGPYLAAVSLQQPGIGVDVSSWRAVGMAETHSYDLAFAHVPAQLIGRSGDYLQRPGFWHGGAGVAACWYGAAAALAGALRQQAARRDEPHAAAHLGAVDVALGQAAALLRETAAWIDRHPQLDARPAALRLRAAVTSAAASVLDHAGRALGATPFCRDGRFARLAADLPVFLRQSHAERDLEALGRAVAAQPGAWEL